MSSFAVRVRHPNGMRKVNVEASMGVDDLVQLVMVETNLRTEAGKPAFRLKRKGVHLKKGSTLEECGVEDDDLLIVALNTLSLIHI